MSHGDTSVDTRIPKQALQATSKSFPFLTVLLCNLLSAADVTRNYGATYSGIQGKTSPLLPYGPSIF